MESFVRQILHLISYNQKCFKFILLARMDLHIIKSTPNGRLFNRRRISGSLNGPTLPALKGQSNIKQVRANTGKIGQYLATQICFIKKKDLTQYKIKNITPLTSSNSKIIQASNKTKQRKYGKINCQPTSIDQFSNLQVSTKSWCLYDKKADKTIGFRQHYKRQIASLTKIMTTLLAIEFILSFKISLNCKVKITKNAVSNVGTTAHLQKNNWISLEDLLYGTMLPSGNDAAYMLAQYIGYFMYLFNVEQKGNDFYPKVQKLDLTQKNTSTYVKQFVGCMNQRVSYMGLFNTQFSNPHGLTNALNLSSASDLIKISKDASQNKLFNKIMNTQQWQSILYQNEYFKKRITRRWLNTNKLLFKGWQGIKTGITPTAGGCLSSVKEGVYIVVLNSSDNQTRFSDTEKIYDWYQKHKRNIQHRQLKMTNSLNLKQQTSASSSFCTLDMIETDVSN